MKSRFRRMMSLAMAIVIAILLAPTSEAGQADLPDDELINEGTTEDGLSYYLWMNPYGKCYAEIVEYHVYGTEVIIPEMIDGDPVTHLNGLPIMRNDILSISIPSNVTHICRELFDGCHSLTEIIVSEGNEVYSSFDGALLNKEGTRLIRCPQGKEYYTVPADVVTIAECAFEACYLLDDVTLPDGLVVLEGSAFALCMSLESIELPDSISTVGDFAFIYCSSLKSLEWPESCDCIPEAAMEDCTSLRTLIIPRNVTLIDSYATYGCDNLTDIYYGGTEEEWAQIVIKEYNDGIENATIHFLGEPAPDPEPAPEPEPAPQPDLHDTLAELTTEDYLAFSAIAYLSLDTDGTVEECMKAKGYWDDMWHEELGITYGALCANIAGWRRWGMYNDSDFNGFYSNTFTNDSGEAVIAYRGSVPPADWGNQSWDAYCDWVLNDLPMELNNTLGPQYDSALRAYETVSAEIDPSKIAVTGHSLGGAWADTVSAVYGCRGVTFNAVSMLDVLFRDKPEEMAQVFQGIDQWNFVDHTNQYDALAGMYEHYLTTEVKPYIAHTGNIPVEQSAMKELVITLSTAMLTGPAGAALSGIASAFSTLGNVAACHGLQSLVTLDGQGKVVMTGVAGSFTPESAVSSYMRSQKHTVDLGTANTDHIQPLLGVLASRTVFGGNSFDVINASIYGDTLIGGGSDDLLDGGWGNDIYFHVKGDGADTIHDAAGNDALYLVGYDEADSFSVQEKLDSEFILVKCNGQIVAQISKKNREYSFATLNRFRVIVGQQEYDITEAFDKFVCGEHLYIACPVSIEILDGEGNVVYTVQDGEPGNFYTDYGSFYVFAEENGEYAKVLDLREGYTARIIGLAEGSMDVSYQTPVNGVLTDPITLTDIPVTDCTTAVFSRDPEGKVHLELDTDGDGVGDECLLLKGQNPFVDVAESQWYYEPVLWAVEEGITSGTTATTFSPDNPCTRAQVVTFLWRAMGEPKAENGINPFEDVKPDAYYYDAVLWAVEEGITSGTSDTAFSPDSPCTRAQVVTFLWRTMDAPAPENGENPFTDVPAGQWYTTPVLWAVENNITSGMNATTFAPNNPCIRAQVVTFLYRTLSKAET